MDNPEVRGHEKEINYFSSEMEGRRPNIIDGIFNLEQPDRRRAFTILGAALDRNADDMYEVDKAEKDTLDFYFRYPTKSTFQTFARDFLLVLGRRNGAEKEREYEQVIIRFISIAYPK